MAQGDWLALHIYHHGDLDRLLEECVLPLAELLTESRRIGNWFFLRYWSGGPHIRFRVDCAGVDERRSVGAETTEAIESYLRAHPSRSTMSRERYRRLARALADLEDLGGFEDRLVPNDSVRIEPYEREYAKFGDEEAMDAVERHFGESSRLAAAAIRAAASHRTRRQVAVATMIASWACLDARFAQTGQGELDSAGRIRRMARNPPGDGSGLVAAWIRSVHRLIDDLTKAEKGGRVAHIPTVVEICAHLFCNRIGIPIVIETALRKAAWSMYRKSPA
ncbi:lantibiotic dehydratase C-terminal domain-containing protein [[Actinomadura] parvosata]|uniref:lantibiotic dehydratase C-terminal domain-containing protein n=1 Tax=[Actinomadura] parvosata TaxID=1955412 RepID=UPI00406C7E2A